MTIKESRKTKLVSYVRLNWGAPFIAAFMGLLMSAVTFLSLGLSSYANNFCIDAFYALTVGIILQLFCFIKYKDFEQSGAA